MKSGVMRTILHIDMDAFFTSIEQRDNPEFRGRPVVVGARPGRRGVVSAASYEARKFGIHSAMPINEAYRRCPSAVYLPPRMNAYAAESRLVMDILAGFSPVVEQVSVDEAFLDATGTGRLFGGGADVAAAIRRAIRERLRLTASIGVASNKFLAKFASDLNKPDGLTVVPSRPEEIVSWLAPHPVGKIWGVGKKTEAILRRIGIITIGDMRKKSPAFLIDTFGEAGRDLYDLCRGVDDRPVENGGDARSISREHTFEKDTLDRTRWKRTLLSLSQDVARSARKSGVEGRTVVFIFRGTDFTKHTRRATLAAPTSLANVIFSRAVALSDSLPERFKLRLIGVGVTGLSRDIQLDLFGGDPAGEPWDKSERAIDRLAERFGEGVVVRGTDLTETRRRGGRRESQ